MDARISAALTMLVLALACTSRAAHAEVSRTEALPRPEAAATTGLRTPAVPSRESSGAPLTGSKASLPCEAFTNAPEKPHDPAALFFAFDQLEHYYRVPGEFTHRLTGDQYGFESLSFIITETHPGGGPGLHVHDTEEAHVLLQGSARYQIGDKAFTVRAPYVARVPAGVPHTFVNVGTEPFNLVAVFASKHPGTRRIGPNPLLSAQRTAEGQPPCRH